jgi:hypothetical protein
LKKTNAALRLRKILRKMNLSKPILRAGCTLMYLSGVPTIDLMKILDHKSERGFLNYENVGKEETAQNLSKHPYFMGSHLKIAK